MLRRRCALLYRGAPQVTVLDCGARVVTYDELAPASCLAVFTRVGCRYEREGFGNVGCSALLEKMAVRGNRRYGPARMQEAFARLGNAVAVTSHRELLFHRADCVRWEVENTFDLLLSMLCDLDTDDPACLDDARQMVLADIALIDHDPSKLLFELVHQAAWDGVTLGQPQWPTPEQLSAVTTDAFHRFVHQFVRPERVCVVARGVEHAEMCRIADERLRAAFCGWERVPIPAELTEGSRYTGGERFVHNLQPPPSMLRFQEKNLTLVGLMFEGVPARDPLFFPKAVAQAMLGGGLSFSAGGPGKGMKTKLYRECLSQHRWLDGIESVSVTYQDSGLFGIYGQAEHDYASQLVWLMAHHAATAADRIDDATVRMARNQFKSQVFMTVEERGASVEDLGRSIALYDRVWSPEEIKAGIDACSVADIGRAVERFTASAGTLAVYGNTDGTPRRDAAVGYMRALPPGARESVDPLAPGWG